MTEERYKIYRDFLAGGGEKKWQESWREADLYRADDKSKNEKRYILDMFPYPSGAGLHVGHVESYTATDIYSRYLRMHREPAYEVLHPQGWDAFGLPAENYAVKTGIHPRETTKKAIATFKRQINSLGFSYDWSREVRTSDPAYYRWTQWFFLFLYKRGLAYRKKAKVNWCDHCRTVLANEQAEGGKCERCGNPVIQKDLEQWFFRITDFIEDQEYEGGKVKGLLSALDELDWPESTKAAQRSWIGRSEGAMVKFRVIARSAATKQARGKSDKDGIASSRGVGTRNDSEALEVFTTRPDTLFGATYMVVCPEHELIANNESRIKNYGDVAKYIEQSKKKTELERMDLAKEKTGVKLEGLSAINPVNNEEIPIFVADYVLFGYGTGAIMAVPAHDERDWEFAQVQNMKHETRNMDEKIKIIPVIAPEDLSVFRSQNVKLLEDNNFDLKTAEAVAEASIKMGPYIIDGININSGFLDGLKTPEAKKKMIAWLEEKGLGRKAINYKLRDWLVSRQRYWGAPIPIVYCPNCGEVPVPEKDLPVLLPDDVDFKPTGESPLKYSKKFHEVKCPKCGAPARREADTMDTFVCSSWYYLRYADPKNDKEFAGKEAMKKWLPVDVYVGGAEHTVLHLLYSRFFTKALQKYGYVDFNEPFLKLRHQGIILAEDGTKMSKSKGNVINPDDVVSEYGADALRLYEMFMGPLEDAKPWSTKGIIGIRRFLEKVWKLAARSTKHEARSTPTTAEASTDRKLEVLLHKTIKKVTEDIKAFKFNTAISQMMIFVNGLEREEEISLIHYSLFLILLSPFAPHLAEELWAGLGHKDSIFKEKWPEYDPKLVKDETFNLAVQVNGKLRDTIEVAADITEEEAKKTALGSEKIKKWLAGKEVVKIIYVKGRLVSIVVK